MKARKNKKVIKAMVPLTKSLSELMKDEDGFVSKENILKVGLSTVAALGVVGLLSDQSHAQITHTNNTVVDPGGQCANHTNHSNYTY